MNDLFQRDIACLKLLV